MWGIIPKPPHERSKTATASVLQPVVADCNPWADFDVDSFIRTVCVQPCHPTGDGRAAHAQFPRHLFPPRTDQSRLGINPLTKVFHNPLSEFKRNLRRTPPRIPCRSMWFRHTVPFLSLYTVHAASRRVTLTRLLPNPKPSTALFQIDPSPSRLALRSQNSPE